MRGSLPRGVVYLLAASLGLAALAHLPALSNRLIYDDVALIEINALLRTTAGLRTLMTHATLTSSPIWPQHYRPLLMLTLWLNYHLGAGVEPLAYRATNLAIHLGNGVLAFFLLRRALERRVAAPLGDWAAAFGASIFLLHPIQSIVIDLVLKRNSSLCALWLFAAVLSYARALDATSTRARAVAFSGALLFGTLAMLTKEDAIVLPALIALWALWSGRGRLRHAAPFCLAPALFALRIAPHETMLRAQSSAFGHLLAQPLALARYAEMLVHPDAIAISYELQPMTQPFPWLRLVALVTLALSVVAVVIGGWRRSPLAALAVAWAVILLMPSSSLFPLFLTMDEVRVYASLLFVFGLMGLGLARLTFFIRHRAARLRSAGFLALSPWLLVAALQAAGDLQQDRLWSDSLAAYAHAVDRYPRSQLGNRGLCEQLFSRTSAPAAIEQCSRAVSLWPYDPTSRYFLVGALAKAGQLERAARVADDAVRDFPASDVAWAARGHLAWFRDDYPAAAAAYRRVLAINPLDDDVRVHLADVLAATGDGDGVRRICQSFAGAPPGRADDRALLASVCARVRP